MHRLAKLLPLALTLVALDLATASAQPVVRDHRTEEKPAPAPSPPPESRDHRSPESQPPRVYRRRPGPRFMMPLKIDIGLQTANSDKGFLPGVEIRVGVHWASLSPEPTNLDIGLGVFGAALIGPPDDTLENNDVVYGGAYLEGGWILSHGKYWRTWAAGRGEYFSVDAFDQSKTGVGLAGRLSAELFASGAGIAPDGLFLGTYAIGVYAEVAARTLGDAVNPLQASAGLTFRTPLVFAP